MVSKKIWVSGEDLKRANPFIEKKGCKLGQTLVIGKKQIIIQL
jgi:hypothetical protein